MLKRGVPTQLHFSMRLFHVNRQGWNLEAPPLCSHHVSFFCSVYQIRINLNIYYVFYKTASNKVSISIFNQQVPFGHYGALFLVLWL